MALVKKTRNPNFKNEEYNLLVVLVDRYKLIIENKDTDAVAGRDKDKAWEEIARIFNAQCGGFFRNGNTLRKFYANKKAAMRKLAAQNVAEQKKTGGGPPVKLLTDSDELLLSIINRKTIYGLDGENFDSDANFGQNSCTSNEIEISPDIYVVDEDNILQKQKDVENIPLLNTAEEQAKNVQDSQNNWQHYKPSDLKKPIHPDLKASIATPKAANDWTSRRRPLINSIPSSEITKKYEMLADLKLEAATILVARMKAESARMKAESQLSLEVLKMELEVKKQQLKKLSDF